MGGGAGGASQKSGKTRAAAAASVRAAAAAPAAAAATPAPAGAIPAALSSPAAAGAAATTPAAPSGPRRQVSPGSAFARRERRGEVVASLRPEIELPPTTTAKKPAAAATSMDIDDDDEAAEAAASAAAALEDLPRAAATVELLTAAPPKDTKVLTDSLADRAAFVEARVDRFAAAFEKAAAAAAAAAGPVTTNGGGEEEDDQASLGSAPVAPVGVARQTARGVFVGRVVDGGSDATTTPAAPADASAEAPPPPPRLDLHSASLEGSAALSGGRRARLDVSALRHRWRLFPGQVVAVVGACPAGHTLVASALLPSAPPPRAPKAAAAVSRAGGDYSSSAATAGMKVVAASGPFTAPGDVAFEALDAVLALAAGKGPSSSSSSSRSSSTSKRPADAVVLVGPFVDERHPAVSSGALDVSFDELFEREVVSRVAEWSRNFGKECGDRGRPPPPVVLLPSPRDVAGGALTSAFPAKPLELPAGTPRNVVALPNPATFRIGGLVFGATGHDVLKDLSASQAAGGLGDGGRGGGGGSGGGGGGGGGAKKNAPLAALPGVAPKDRMAGLAGALLEQGCFYPLYPPARGTMLDSRLALGNGDGAGGGGVPPPSTSSSSRALSSSSSSSPSVVAPYPGLAMPFSPDVLLLPSDLAPFARVATAEAPPALRIDESGELVVASSSSTTAATTSAAGAAGAPSPSSDSALPPPQPGVEAVAVNPGRAVTAGGGGGTAAVIILGARRKEEEEKEGAAASAAAAADDAVDNDVVSRCRVDIVRL